MATLRNLFDFMELIEAEQAFDSVERYSEQGHWVLALGGSVRVDLIADAKAGVFLMSAPVLQPHRTRRLEAAESVLVASHELARNGNMSFSLESPGDAICLNARSMTVPDSYPEFAGLISDFSSRVLHWQAGLAEFAEPAAETTNAFNPDETFIRV